ncbi:16S rRNA (cytosine(1402)-N(4))-methyltransferase RsmH [Mycoplasma iguanae]|uniref:Ribosomal RNA small subunit methyltransferase H n=1 Tax=Mycoplasma iguanae TaxID=292461 RepID=A0ABY5RAF0_9MOLU|nr:16S rRNA (cytosine(1402)-N(4))-methyltransferase RsmH [Mycoplasma iguanae]UVD81965.1 16S rRNA (cytosine(1402)-N(4))-methyltransferase RsmH [Mycoplasma iguanae]
MKHQPVLLKEVLQALDIQANETYVDLTLGRAGHSEKILEGLTTGLLVAFDKDQEAIEESSLYLSKRFTNFHLVHADFQNIEQELKKLKIESVKGILIDLGVSSPQLDAAERGFSYNKNARLDMRMNKDQDLDAHFIVNNYSEVQLVNIFKTYADVKLPQKVAKSIIENRPINTTLELVEIIKHSLPAYLVRQKNPAKAVFQALRVEVNNELESLKKMLKDSLQFLTKNSKLAIITFHSIEDRIVKNFFGNLIKGVHHHKLPILEEKQWKVKVYNPSAAEILENPRSRSAKLRVLTKLF